MAGAHDVLELRLARHTEDSNTKRFTEPAQIVHEFALEPLTPGRIDKAHENPQRQQSLFFGIEITRKLAPGYTPVVTREIPQQAIGLMNMVPWKADQVTLGRTERLVKPNNEAFR
jgi:hypothetical protein